MRYDQLDAWDEHEHAAWLDTWAPRCPIGNLQRAAHLVGYREREPGRLQLRAVIRVDEGLCEVIAEEDEESVRVRVLLCYEDTDDPILAREALNWPIHVYLEQPLNGRTVISVDTDEPLPLYVSRWDAQSDPDV